jgi:hypothetical protein
MLVGDTEPSVKRARLALNISDADKAFCVDCEGDEVGVKELAAVVLPVLSSVGLSVAKLLTTLGLSSSQISGFAAEFNDIAMFIEEYKQFMPPTKKTAENVEQDVEIDVELQAEVNDVDSHQYSDADETAAEDHLIVQG